MNQTDSMMAAGDGEIGSRGPAMEVVACIFLAITWFFVILRIWVRGFLIKSWGWDDTIMILSLFLFSGYCVCIKAFVSYGGGSRIRDPSHVEELVKYTVSSEALYVATMVALKISLGIFFLRICIKKWQIYTIWAVMLASTAYGVTYTFLIIFQCGNPASYMENRMNGRCVSRSAQLGLAYSHAAVGAATDWTFALLPFFVLWNVTMDLRSKITVSIIIVLGVIGSVATLIRIQYLWTLGVDEDFFYHAALVAIWSTIEPGLGIAAASLATFRPLLRLIWKEACNIVGATYTGSSRSRHRSSRPMELEKTGPQSLNIYQPRSPTANFPPAASEERLWPASPVNERFDAYKMRSDEEATVGSSVYTVRSGQERWTGESRLMLSPVSDVYLPNERWSTSRRDTRSEMDWS